MAKIYTAVEMTYNSQPAIKILEWTKLKVFFCEMRIFVVDVIKRNCWKRENTAYQHFLLFLQ